MLYGSGRLAKFRPSFVGSEPSAMRPCEFCKTRDHGVNAASACVGQRAATEGCKSGAEYDAGVDEISVGDDFLAQYSGAFVGKRKNESVFEVGRRLRRWRRGFLRLAIDPLVEPFTALASEFFGGDQRIETRGVRLLLVECL